MKRIFDIIITVILFVLLSFIFIVIAFLILITLGKPILFTQMRPGLNGELFKIYKFRTMKIKYDKNGMPLHDSQRLTRFGAWLRRTSLDELPTLWNVLCGHMSLVGPRPLLIEYLSLYSPEQKRRHNVKPGITGWAQVNGRNAVSWEEKFKLDVWYVENHNFCLDLKILFLTIIAVFKSTGITQEGHVTTEKFRGSN